MAAFGFMSAGRILVAFILLWIILIFFVGGPIFRKDPDGPLLPDDTIIARLAKASSELKSLKSQNEELRSMIETLVPLKNVISPAALSANPLLSSQSGGPSFDYERSLRKAVFDVDELWNYVRRHLNTTQKEFVSEVRHSILYDLSVVRKRDENWRSEQLKSLQQSVQNVISKLQNPVSCDSAKKLSCTLNKGCGFGCQVHHLVYCFVVALAENRTLILNSRNWRYADRDHKRSKTAGWNAVFQPLSTSCLEEGEGRRSNWLPGHDSAQILELPIIDSMRPRPDFLPLAVPVQIADRLEHLHGSPIAWFLGQIMHYSMRLSEDMEQFIADAKYRLNFRTPIVGIHVRRTDKVGSEAAFHPLSEYMKLVEDYYQNLELSRSRMGNKEVIEKLVYLATDDPGIWTKELPAWEEKGFSFLGDAEVANSAGIGTRYAVDSLRNVILDIWLLSQCDYLVCTFSSQVCRVAYELMQTRAVNGTIPDWSQAFDSLDDIYYFGGQSDHDQIAILKHVSRAEGELDMDIGDTIGIAGNHWDGFSKGINRRTFDSGIYPGFKTAEKVKTAHFKAFDELYTDHTVVTAVLLKDSP